MFINLFYRSVRSDKRKEQKNLLKKVQTANEKISSLENALSQAQDDAKSQSSKVRHLYFYT
jgi:septal ring factor EnvC (AmiA/AmiB activator)